MDSCTKRTLGKYQERNTLQAGPKRYSGDIQQKEWKKRKGQGRGKRRVKLRHCLWFAATGIFLLNLLFQPLAHWQAPWDKVKEPEQSEQVKIQKEDIRPLLQKSGLDRHDYGILFCQTGLGREAIDCLRKENRAKSNRTILEFQEAFLKRRETECCSGGLFIKQDKLISEDGDPIPMIPLEDGDIFLSFSSHTLGWRHGHAGLVVDGDAGMCLEAAMPGCRSRIQSADHWTTFTNFVVLRLKGASKKERKEIAAFARKNLEGIPYSLFSGIFDKREQEPYTEMTAQCAYLIWYGFMQFGHDLDGDGGRLVTVEDLLESPNLEILQIFGLDPKLDSTRQ